MIPEIEFSGGAEFELNLKKGEALAELTGQTGPVGFIGAPTHLTCDGVTYEFLGFTSGLLGGSDDGLQRHLVRHSGNAFWLNEMTGELEEFVLEDVQNPGARELVKYLICP